MLASLLPRGATHARRGTGGLPQFLSTASMALAGVLDASLSEAPQQLLVT